MLRQLINCRILFLLIFTFLVVAVTNREREKQSSIALLVGVGEFIPGSEWEHLNTDNDLDLIKSTLIEHGFQEKNIAIVQNEKATRKGIMEAIQKHLVRKAKLGSNVFFYFTGHGQQVADNDYDEIDGYDEALVSYNSPKYFDRENYQGENLIRDEELGELLNKVRKKLGPNGHVFTLIDACHSGTATRGFGVSRGTDVIMADPDYISQQTDKNQDYNRLDGEIKGEDSGLAPMVSFFSSSARESSLEWIVDSNGYGLMTYAFCKAFSGISKTDTYRGLFEEIKREVSSKSVEQTPQAEGLLDQRIFNGEVLNRPEYYLIKKLYSGRNAILNAGTLAGLDNNSKMVLYPSDTRDFDQNEIINTGVLSHCSLFNCDLNLDSVFTNEMVKGSWVYVKERSYGDLSANLKMNISDKHFDEQLMGAFSNFTPIRITEATPELILTDTVEQRVLLLTSDGNKLVDLSMDYNKNYKDIIAKIIQECKHYLRASYIRQLDMNDDSLELEIRLRTMNENQIYSFAGNLEFKLNDKIELEIINVGHKAAYFTLIGVHPNNQIEPIFPNEGYYSDDCYLRSGQSFNLKDIRVDPPVGKEVLKLIATQTSIDIPAVINSRGMSDRGYINPLEILFAETYFRDTTRSGQTINLLPNTADINTLVFEIVD